MSSTQDPISKHTTAGAENNLDDPFWVQKREHPTKWFSSNPPRQSKANHESKHPVHTTDKGKPNSSGVATGRPPLLLPPLLLGTGKFIPRFRGRAEAPSSINLKENVLDKLDDGSSTSPPSSSKNALVPLKYNLPISPDQTPRKLFGTIPDSPLARLRRLVLSGKATRVHRSGGLETDHGEAISTDVACGSKEGGKLIEVPISPTVSTGFGTPDPTPPEKSAVLAVLDSPTPTFSSRAIVRAPALHVVKAELKDKPSSVIAKRDEDGTPRLLLPAPSSNTTGVGLAPPSTPARNTSPGSSIYPSPDDEYSIVEPKYQDPAKAEMVSRDASRYIQANEVQYNIITPSSSTSSHTLVDSGLATPPKEIPYFCDASTAKLDSQDLEKTEAEPYDLVKIEPVASTLVEDSVDRSYDHDEISSSDIDACATTPETPKKATIEQKSHLPTPDSVRKAVYASVQYRGANQRSRQCHAEAASTRKRCRQLSLRKQCDSIGGDSEGLTFCYYHKDLYGSDSVYTKDDSQDQHSDKNQDAQKPRPPKHAAGLSHTGEKILCQAPLKKDPYAKCRQRAILPDIDRGRKESDTEHEESKVVGFCNHHSNRIMTDKYCGGNVKAYFSEYIHDYLGASNKVALRNKMGEPVSKSDVDGFIYALEIRDGTGAIKFKVGRTNNINRRTHEWHKQCCSTKSVDIEMTLRGYYPPMEEKVNLLPGLVKQGQPSMFSHRLERLIHIELADIAAHSWHLLPNWPNIDAKNLNEDPFTVPGVPKKIECSGCGKRHQEIFEFKRFERENEGKEWELIVEPVIRKWGKFVKSHLSL